MRRIRLGTIPALCSLLVFLAAAPIRAAEPVTIPFDDIYTRPYGYDFQPPLLSKGVVFYGGALQQRDDVGVWYRARKKNVLQMIFPAGSTDISFDVAGRGDAVYPNSQRAYMALQVWEGYLGNGILAATLPIPSPDDYDMVPPTETVTLPGPLSMVTIFTEMPPPGSYDWAYMVNIDNVRYTPPDPEPTIAFDLPSSTDVRVLTNNYGFDPYPSPLQTAAGKIRVEATVRVNGQPAPGKTVHFRLTDPPDPAAYAAATSQMGDNFDGPGSLNGVGPTASAVSDGSGRVSLTLHVSGFAAGDNYQIEASSKPEFPCALSCPKSAVYTAWKRVYREVDRMFRRGAYITEDAAVGSKTVFVSDLSQFHSGDLVRFIHAPRLQAISSGVSDVTDFFYSEDHVVDVVAIPTTLPNGKVVAPHLELRGTATLSAPFGVDRSFSSTPSVPGVPYLRDAVGVIAAGFYEPDLSLIGSTYETMFVEMVPAANAVPELPYERWAPLTMTAHFGNKWFESGQRTPSGSVSPNPNHVQILGATRKDNPVTASPTAGAQLGFTPILTGRHHSWVWVQRIEQAVAEPLQNVFSLSASNVNSEVTLHESVHQWRVNPVPPTATVKVGHCLSQRYQQDGKYCLMHAPFYSQQHNAELGDGLADFHYTVDASGKVDSEYVHIRQHAEPFVK